MPEPPSFLDVANMKFLDRLPFEIETSSLLTVLNFSGGTGSGCLMEMVLNGDLLVPEEFFVCCADPGMENAETYDYVAVTQDRCEKQNIEFHIIKTNLFSEMLSTIQNKESTRFDFPPFWTKNRISGKRGRLLQKCTSAYKIAPMDRLVRKVLERRLGISHKSKNIGQDIVRKWIGFSFDELLRIKEAKQKYVRLEYPLIKLRMKKLDIALYYQKIGKKLPPRSVCNACFANDIPHFKKMYHERPFDFSQAVAVDNAIRDLTQFGITDECYVSYSLISLTDLVEMDFNVKENKKELDCHSGYCFV